MPFKNKEQSLEYQREYQREYYKQTSKHRRTTDDWRAKQRQRDLERQPRKQEHRREQMRRLIELRGGICEQCGRKDDFVIYDFHHIDPNTKHTRVSTATFGSWKTAVQESEKCELLCCFCHRVRHRENRTLITYQQIKRETNRIALTSRLGGCCTVCGLSGAPVICYDFHHRDPQQKQCSVAQLICKTTNLERIWIEAAKCVLLCCICHRKLHNGLISL